MHDHPLHKAVIADPIDPHLIKTLLQQGHHPNSLNAEHFSPLHLLLKQAPQHPDQLQTATEGLQLLVKAGADCMLASQYHALRPCDIVYMRGRAGHAINFSEHLWPQDSEWYWSNFITQSNLAHSLCEQMLHDINAECRAYKRYSRWRPWHRAAERHAAVLLLEHTIKDIQKKNHQAVKHILGETATPFPGGVNPIHTLQLLKTAVQTARHGVSLQSCGIRGLHCSDWYQRNRALDEKLATQLRRIHLIMHPAEAKQHCLEIIKREILIYSQRRTYFWNRRHPNRDIIMDSLKLMLAEWEAIPVNPGSFALTLSSMQHNLNFQIKSINSSNSGRRGPRFSHLRQHMQIAVREIEYFTKIYSYEQKLTMWRKP